MLLNRINPTVSSTVNTWSLPGTATGVDTPTDERNQPIPGRVFLAGGQPLTGHWGPDVKKLTTVNALNLTPDPSGVSYMNEAMFIKAIRTGQVQARVLSNIMPWILSPRRLTDGDLKAMFAYLRTVKPVQHRVDNTEPPGRPQALPAQARLWGA